jgi:hypothetical protein
MIFLLLARQGVVGQSTPGESDMSPTVKAILQAKERQAASRAASLTASNRLLDPFGIAPNQNINEARFAPDDQNPSNDAGSMVAPVQQDITSAVALANLPIDGIDPFNREFFVGPHNIYQGDVMTVGFMGRTWKFLVQEVRSTAIFFEEMETGQAHRVDISIIPETYDFPVMEAP